MTDIDYEKTFGFNPTSIGNRYRHHHLIGKPDYDDELAGAKEGYLCVRARDGASNPIDPDACRYPNFVGTAEDGFDATYRYYYYRPLTDADREDPAALIASQAKRIAELEKALEPLVDEFGCSIEQYDRIGPDWTHKDGTEVFEVSTLLDRRELIDRARATLKGEG